MKRLFTIISCAVLVGSVTASCTKEFEEGQAGKGNATVNTIMVTAEAPELLDTRVSLNDDNYIVWTAGDAIKLHGSTSVDATLATGEEGKKTVEPVSFTYTGELTGDVVGVYPASADKGLGNVYIHNVQASSVVESKKYMDSLEEAVKNCVLIGRQAEGKMTLYNATSVVEIELKGNGEKLYAVNLMSRSKNLSGYYTYDSSAEKPVLVPVEDVQGKAEGGVVANVDGELTLSSTSVKIYFIVPAYTYPAGDLYIEVITDKYSMTKVSGTEHTFNRNRIRPFATINVEKPVYDGAEDLSAEGMSNCYLVKSTAPAADYAFSIYDRDNNTLVSEFAWGAKVAWQTSDNLVTNVTADIDNKKILVYDNF